LPLWINMTDGNIDQVIDASYQALKTL
jgi:hypothetical protein